ncbi:MAG: S8 family serine peptidase [Janthinobacterium lividum]
MCGKFNARFHLRGRGRHSAVLQQLWHRPECGCGAGWKLPAGDDEAVSGWVRGACSSGLPNTADGLPTDVNHSEGCFNLGHTAYVQAIGTSGSAPLVAGVVAMVRAAHPDWPAATVVAAVRASAVPTTTLPYGVVNAAAAIAYRP